MSRRASRTDANQGEIIDALHRIGCVVQSLAMVGQGVPDLLVARGLTGLWLMECKDGSKPPSERKLTPEQKKWHARWPGPVYVVNSPEEAVAIVLGQVARAA